MAVRVVFVGAGHGHLYALKRTREFTSRGFEVCLVAPELFWYSGLATGVLGGRYPASRADIDLVDGPQIQSGSDIGHGDRGCGSSGRCRRGGGIVETGVGLVCRKADLAVREGCIAGLNHEVPIQIEPDGASVNLRFQMIVCVQGYCKRQVDISQMGRGSVDKP